MRFFFFKLFVHMIMNFNLCTAYLAYKIIDIANDSEACRSKLGGGNEELKNSWEV